MFNIPGPHNQPAETNLLIDCNKPSTREEINRAISLIK